MGIGNRDECPQMRRTCEEGTRRRWRGRGRDLEHVREAEEPAPAAALLVARLHLADVQLVRARRLQRVDALLAQQHLRHLGVRHRVAGDVGGRVRVERLTVGSQVRVGDLLRVRHSAGARGRNSVYSLTLRKK